MIFYINETIYKHKRKENKHSTSKPVEPNDNTFETRRYQPIAELKDKNRTMGQKKLNQRMCELKFLKSYRNNIIKSTERKGKNVTKNNVTLKKYRE